MDTYFDVSKMRIKLILTGIAGVKNIGCNFRNTYVWFSWASSSEMIKFSSHETQQIAVEIATKILGLHVQCHLLFWWLICRLDLFARYRWIKKAQIAITATTAMIDKYWVTVSSAPIYKTRGVSVLLPSTESQSSSQTCNVFLTLSGFVNRC